MTARRSSKKITKKRKSTARQAKSRQPIRSKKTKQKLSCFQKKLQTWRKLAKQIKRNICPKQNKKSKSKKHHQKRGFTLLETLIIITIIGILVAIGLTSYTNIQARARDTKRKNDLDSLQEAVELYHLDYDTYPASALIDWGGSFTDGSTVYMAEVPQDPSGNTYVYEYLEVEDGYRLYSTLENVNDEDFSGWYYSDDIDCEADNACNYVITSTNVPDPISQVEPDVDPTATPTTVPPTTTPVPPTSTPVPPTSTPTLINCGNNMVLVDGQCECVEGYIDSDGDPSNGCEDLILPTSTPIPTPEPTSCPSPSTDMDCTGDAECIACYGSMARCMPDRCEVPTGVVGGGDCTDDFDCFPDGLCIDNLCQ